MIPSLWGLVAPAKPYEVWEPRGSSQMAGKVLAGGQFFLLCYANQTLPVETSRRPQPASPPISDDPKEAAHRLALSMPQFTCPRLGQLLPSQVPCLGDEWGGGSTVLPGQPSQVPSVSVPNLEERISLFPRVQPIVFMFKEKLTMKRDSLTKEKLECSLWCCLSDPSPPGLAACCCVLERRIVPWMRQESYSSSSPIWFVDSDEPNLMSVLERLEDTKNNNLNRTTEEVTSKEKEEEMAEDIDDLDHYEMKEEPINGKKLKDEGTEKENWAILEKIRKTERQDHLNAAVSGSVQASDRFMKELGNIYRSQSYKTDFFIFELVKIKNLFVFELYFCFVILRVDPDSALHSDLQIVKEKEGIGDILLNLSFKNSRKKLSLVSDEKHTGYGENHERVKP
ncbi:PREDICTED: uncharacterized protein LOC105549483 [Mandrillus leucophaeus]|uniref:uncharacterized protein LOC105549483 n=1 Tax=Mandrillus leucophaeus TaxID=9568 RepID=UPI0005F4E0BB|nr:PREDICTED: uncharacterized protein LOC105549483 [Mandrillus leucophaeus]